MVVRAHEPQMRVGQRFSRSRSLSLHELETDRPLQAPDTYADLADDGERFLKRLPVGHSATSGAAPVPGAG